MDTVDPPIARNAARRRPMDSDYDVVRLMDQRRGRSSSETALSDCTYRINDRFNCFDYGKINKTISNRLDYRTSREQANTSLLGHIVGLSHFDVNR